MPTELPNLAKLREQLKVNTFKYAKFNDELRRKQEEERRRDEQNARLQDRRVSSVRK